LETLRSDQGDDPPFPGLVDPDDLSTISSDGKILLVHQLPS
jgi:hypothetical protein